MARPGVDYADVQGLVRYGYSRLTEAAFLLLTIREAAAAHAWIAAAPVTNAVERNDAPESALQIAFTADGLRALGVSDTVIAGFSNEFVAGMPSDANRSRRLGDVGVNAQENWEWGGLGNIPHVLLMLYAKEGKLPGCINSVKGPNFDRAFTLLHTLPTSNLDNTEPFGFVDGISQPQLDWERQRLPKSDELEYGNLVALGEFLLGYPNEYGLYTDRPLLLQEGRATSLLRPAEDVPGKLDLGKNGTYLVIRTLDQDVRGFWRFLDQATNRDPRARQQLAESMVGRTMEGNSLVPLAQTAIPGIATEDAGVNQFTYDDDPQGTGCPFGAHIRRSNPRNADLPPVTKGIVSKLIRSLGFGVKGFRSDVVASTRFHRILRRGREYGPEMTIEQALASADPDPHEHGIQFICLNANITRQFEFVQGSWLMSTKFNAMTEESDPLLGNRQPVPGCPFTDTFSRPRQGQLRERITGVPQFIRVRGGAYFFLPSLSAISYFATSK
jgi:deferrochelatase/peroxidase EfeB